MGDAPGPGPARLNQQPYGRHSVDRLGATPAAVAPPPPTYYGRPALKASHWGWLIITYLFVGGVAGAAQVIASVVDLLGHRRDRRLVSAGRYLALGGSLISPVLLIADLGTPSRWYNMVRIYRSTSPMSIGSWTLVAFGSFSGLAAVFQLAADVLGLRFGRRLARWCGVPAAACGALLCTYTGSLLAATSSPLWATAYRWLPAAFGASGTATAIAAMRLVLGDSGLAHSTRRRLDMLAALVSGLELGLVVHQDRTWRRAGVHAPIDEPRLAAAYRLGMIGMGILAPLGVHLLQVLTGRELAGLSRLASLAALVGGFSHRAVVTLAGKRSAERPTDYFQIAQPPRVPELTGDRRSE